MDKKFLYPITEETLHKYAKSIFNPINRGECVTTIWLPMSGRRKHNKFLIEHIQLFGSELPDFKKTILVYIEPLELTEETLTGYLRLMAKTFVAVGNKNPKIESKLNVDDTRVFNDPETSYSILLGGLRDLLEKVLAEGVNVVFFIGEFDELSFTNKIFYNNLMSLWNDFTPQLNYVFLMRENVENHKNLGLWGELSEIILQNIVFVPTLSKEDDDYMIKRSEQEFSIEPTNPQLKTIKEICGGHPYLLRETFRLLENRFNKNLNDDQIRDLFYDNYKLRWVMRKVFEARNQEERKVLAKIALRENFNKGENKGSLDFLEKMGLVKMINGELRPFNKLFSRTIQGFEKSEILIDEDKPLDLTLDAETQAIVHNGKTVEEKFTRQEYMVLAEFLRFPNKLVTRDSVGKVLWGKEMYEKYSDWALDQLISKLRKKLKSLGVKQNLITIRGKGYKILQTSS